MKPARLALVSAAALAALAFAGVLQPSGANGSADDTSPGGITVNGTGSKTVTPDRAGFAFGTVSEAKTAAAALAASSDAVTRIIAALQKAGVAKADLQTAEVSVSPRTNANGDEIVGYTASNTVTAVVRRLGDAGAVIDAAVGAGASAAFVGGVVLYVLALVGTRSVTVGGSRRTGVSLKLAFAAALVVLVLAQRWLPPAALAAATALVLAALVVAERALTSESI